MLACTTIFCERINIFSKLLCYDHMTKTLPYGACNLCVACSSLIRGGQILPERGE